CVDPVEDGRYAAACAGRPHVHGGLTREQREIRVREAVPLGATKERRVVERLGARRADVVLDGDCFLKAVEKPRIDPRDRGDRSRRRSGAEGRENREDPFGSWDAECVGLRRGRWHGGGWVDPSRATRLEGPDRLSEGLREGAAEGHDLAHGFHLDAERGVGAGELLERESRDLHDDIVERGLEGGRRLLRDVVRDLVEAVPYGEKSGDLRDREPRRLRSERGRARDAWVHLDDDPAPRLWVYGELDVRAARRDADGANDLFCIVAPCLLLDVRERHLRRDRDGIARVDAHRVEVLDG